jgi:hypothetical protein
MSAYLTDVDPGDERPLFRPAWVSRPTWVALRLGWRGSSLPLAALLEQVRADAVAALVAADEDTIRQGRA